MKLYQPGDTVEVDVNSGLSDTPKWVPAVVTAPTNPRYGWTPATTTGSLPRIDRGPGWNPNEIREVG